MLVYQRVTNVLTWKTSMGKTHRNSCASLQMTMRCIDFTFFKIGPKYQSTCSGWVHIMPPYCLDLERVVLLVVQICILVLWYVWQIIDKLCQSEIPGKKELIHIPHLTCNSELSQIIRYRNHQYDRKTIYPYRGRFYDSSSFEACYELPTGIESPEIND